VEKPKGLDGLSLWSVIPGLLQERAAGDAPGLAGAAIEFHDDFAQGWMIETSEPSRFEVRADVKELVFGEGGPKAWFGVRGRQATAC
jgi:hypothetical protein